MLRRMNKFFSILLIICLVFSLIPPLPAKAAVSTIYLKVNSEWKTDNARFAAYFFNDSAGTNTWVSMTSKGNDYYSCSVPSGYPNVIFCRMTPSDTSNNWDNRWNQTGNLTVPSSTSSSVFSMSSGSWDSGSWGACGHPSHNTSAACTVCGTTVSHSWNSGSVTKAATCTATGVKTYTCTVCSGTKTETIDKLAHSYGAATCTEPQTCSCGATTGSALGHSWNASTGKCSRCSTSCSHSYTSKVTAATCSAQGYTTYTCSTCKYSYNGNYTSALGHSWNASTGKCSRCSTSCSHSYTSKVTAANCTAQGYTTYTCSTCKYSYQANYTSALGHNYVYTVTKNPTTSAAGTLVGTCSRCSASTGNITIGYLCTTYHTYKVVTAATCTTAGTGRYTWKITDYGTYYWDVSIPAKGHSYGAATCTEPQTCSTCGATTGNALGHNYTSTVTKAATCTAAGVRTYTCSRCSDVYTEEIAATGHSYVGGKCSGCGDTKVVSINGDFNGWAGANMTHSENGYTYSVTLAAATYKFKLIKDGTWLGNNGEIWDTTTATSSVGWEFVDWGDDCTLVATGGTYNFTFLYDTNMLIITYNHTHAYTAGEVVAPTCTAKGYTVYTCACGATENRDEKAALGHSYNSGVVTTAATCTTDGVKTFTCSRCDHSYTEAIAKLGHDYKATVTAPTCTAQGYTTHTCSRCSDSYKDTYTDALGHNYSYAVTKEPTTSASGTLTGTCSRCSSKPTVTLPNLNTTDYSYTETKAPGCTTTGTGKYTWKTTTYGSYSFTVTVPANGHSYGDASCSDPATCSVCGATTGSALGHSYSYAVTKEPTTGASGTLTGTCSRCSGKTTVTLPNLNTTDYTYSVTKTETCTTSGTGKYTWITTTYGSYSFNVTIPAKNHSYSSVVTAPTCTAEGYTTHTCANCGDTYRDAYTAALDHNYTSKVTTAATCESAGVKTYTCSRCDHVYTEEIAAIGHSYVGGKCGNCGDTKVVSVNGSFNDWAGANMTWTSGGYTYTIDLPAETYEFKIVKDGAWMGNNGTIEDTTTATSDIGWEFVAGDDYGNCTLIANGGTYTFTFNFDTNMLVIVNDHSHSYTAGEVVAPTCTAQGYTVYTCPCGDSYHGDIKAALEHSYSEAITTAPGCETTGVKTYTCSRCSDVYTEEIAATGHSYVGGKCGNCGDTKVVSINGDFNGWAGANMTYSENGYTYSVTLAAATYKFKLIKDGTWLGNNGEIWDTTTATSSVGWEFADWGDDCTLVATGGTYNFTFLYDTNMLIITYNHTHAYTAGEVVAPTCTAKGYTVYTCACGDSYHGDEKAALDHSYTSAVTKTATCTEDGVRTYTCSRCDHSYTEVIEKLGHDYKATVTAPTCTAQGYTTYTCSRCSDSYKDTYTDALGHNYQNGACQNCGDSCEHKYSSKVTKEPTCTDEGVRTYTCSVCSGSYTEAIEKLGHSYSEQITDATCENAGVKTYTCSKCDHSYTEEIAATGHSYGEGVVTAPTCTAGGYTTYTCACGHSYTDSETAATGHKYVGGICENCGAAEVVDAYITVYFQNNWLWTDVYVYYWNDAGYNAAFPGEAATFYANDGTYDIYCVTMPAGCSVIFSGTKDDGSGNTDQTPDITGAQDGACYSMVWDGDNEKNGVLVDDIENVMNKECEHSYTEEITTAATCTTAGVKTYTCSKCDHSYTEEIPALNHNYVDGTCANCGEAEPVVEYITVYFQNNWLWTDVYVYYWNDAGYNAAFPGEAATFYANDGTYDIYCVTMPAGCSVIFSGTKDDGSGNTDQTPDITDAYDGACYSMVWDGDNEKNGVLVDDIENVMPSDCEHSYDAVITAPTCTVAGYTTYTCSKCDHSYTEEIAATGHSYVNGVCSACGHAKDDNIKIHFVNTLGWQGVVAYAWRDIGGSPSALNGISWPGVIVQRDNDGYYTLEVEYVPANGESLGVLFHNFNGGQTADVLIDYATLSTSHEIWVKPATSTNSSGKYTCTVVAAENATTISPEVNGNQVTFRYSGSATAVYLAGSMNGWSSTATAMTKGEDGVWSVTLTLDPGVYEYKFVVDGNWTLDPLNGNVGGYDGNNTVVVPADDVTTNTGTITVVLHFYRANGDYSGWDVWYWGAEKSGAATFSADPDNKGMIATFTLDGSRNSNAGYTIRKSDWSDKEFYDRFIDLSDVVSGTVHYYVTSGVATGSRVLGEDVVAKGKLAYANYNYDNDTIWVKASLPLANPVAGNFSIVDGDNNATGIAVTSATLEGNGYKLTLSKGLTLSQFNTYKVKFDNSYATISLSTHDLFYTSKFASEYTYYGDDLGVTWSRNSTTFKVWAPTAQNVYVKIYDSGNYGSGNQVKYVQMTAGDKGVWSVTVSGNWHGYYYNFDVVFPSYTVEATDPYARSTGLNGDRGMILNLDATDPAGWDNDISPNQGMSYTDAIIYEMHVREFTLDSNSGVNSAWRGKFLGLTQTGTTYNGHATGLDYLKEMGVTHVQLMPVFDFKSVDEYYGGGYSWGYDPQNYNVPEGSYSTNPGDGSVRVTEFKEMVQTFHENGINVVMDVVYNHAFDGGNFCYNKIVPNYFSRFYGEGNWSNGSGVGNDFATERTMARNYIVDSVLYWVEEYHIDGFRFDLAGLIDTTTINEIVNTVHAKYPHVIFYGEGWAAGDTAVEYGNSLATKGNAYQTPGFGYFNDDFRNAIAGNNGNSTGFASGNGYTTDSIANYFRAGNSWAQSPSQSINYVSAHDNYCLNDKLLISRNGAYWDEICRMNALSGALVLLSEGVPFLYSGDEMLRERKDSSGNRVENGYNAGDYANQINWADLTYKENADRTSDYYAGLIEFRKNHAALRCTSGSDAWNYVSYHKISDQTIMMYVSGYPNYECSDGIVIIFNASSSYVNVNLNNYGIPQGYWQATIHGTQAGVTPLWGVNVDGSSGTVGVEGISTTVLVLGDLIHEESVYNAQPSSCSHAKHNTSAMCTSCGKTVSHTYVNGSCSVCGLSQNAPATYTVYYDNSTTGWSNVNIYAWTTTAGQTQEYTGNWSGSAMTLIDEENGIYAYELPIGAQNVIFSGDGSQTENLTAPGYTSGATLYSDGSWIVYEGACDHSYTDSYIEEPTCIMDGVIKHTCDICGYSYTEDVEALGHDYVTEVTEPTCVNGGFTTYTCSRCSDSYVDDHVAALRHNYVDGVCDVCGTEKAYFLFGYINGANYGADGDEATMGIYKFVDGQLTVTFKENSYVGVKTIDNENWYMTDGYLGEEVTSATLYDTSAGIDADKLFVPGQMKITFTLVENADGTLTLSYGAAACEHEYDEGVVTEPSCTATGYTTYTCSICGHSYVDNETEIIDHSFVDGFCENCGAIDPAVCVHEYDEGVVTEPTCDEAGYTTYTCSICGHSYTDHEVEALGHSYEDVVTEPTCTEGGYTTHTCTVCGDSYTDSETEAAGHDFADGLCTICGAVDPATCVHEYDEGVVTEPTCTDTGYTTYTCKLCGHSYVGDETETVEHSYVDGICSVCGAIDLAVCEHEYESEVTDPTCTEGGYTTHTCSVCGDSYTDTETEATGHDFVNGVCSVCGESDGEVSDCEHDYVKTAATASCTEPGGDKYTCSKCGDVYYENEVAPLGHSYVDGICERCGDLKPLSTTYYLIGWINGSNHGCEEDSANMGNYKITDNMFKFTFDQASYVFLKTEGNGKWFMCDGYPGDGVCFANLYDTSLPINHDKVNVPGGVEITFTLIERDDGSVTLTYVTAGNCSHNWYTQTQVWPGCTTTGVMLHRCIMCAESYTTTIAATGHNYSGAYCTNCGASNPNYTYYYQIVGWINGGNVGCEENWEQAGYQFSGNCLTMTFTENSYIYIKTHDNSKWYMTDGYPGDDATSATFYHTDSYGDIQQDKMFVPKGRTITFTLSVRSDNTIYLSYVAASCQHTYDSWMNVEATCTTDGERAYKCSKCDDYYTEVVKATGHSFVDGACEHCGAIDPAVCEHVYGEGAVTEPTCTEKGYTTYICTICGYEHIGDETEKAPHDFVDGICSVCGAEEDDGMITVYFQNNWLWTDVYVYYWNDDGANAEFPGEPATWYANDGTYDIYCVTMPAGSNVIFSGTKNDGSGASDQTPDIIGAQDGDCYYMTWNEGNDVGKENIDNIIGECEHEYESVVTEPGCATPGYTTYTCSKCDDTYVDTHTAPLGHSFDENGSCECGESRIEETQDFYLIGYINGANYGCDEDWENLGIYKFVDGKLVAYFKQDSYVFAKTGDNQGWYMASQFSGKDIPYAELCNTSTGTSEKLFVPGGMKITFVLVRTGDDSFILGYTASACEHPEHTITGKCEYCGEYVGHDYEIVTNAYSCTAEGGVVHTCDCGASYITNVVPAAGHIFVDGACKVCGVADESHCDHLYEMTVHNGYCHLGAYTVNTCELCSHCFYIYYDANADWTLVKPEFIHDDLLQTKLMYSYSDRETTTSDSDTLEGWTLIDAELVDPENGIYEYTFERWTDWSDWSDEVYTESEDRRVQITTAYRNTDAVICEHDYVIVVTDPTCEQMGYTTHTCSRCGVSYVCDYTDMLGHNYESVVIEPGCLEDGYTKHTCSNCGDSYTTDEIPAAGAHTVVYSFVDNKHTVTCTVCGLSTSVDGTNELKFRAISLALGSDISINYKATVDACFTDVYVVFEVGPKQTFVYDYTIDPATGRYVFSYNGINPQLMGENISATLYGTLDGIEVSCNYAQYSVLQYCTTQLKKDTISAEFRTLISDLLTYGSMVQILKNFETDSLLVDRVPEDCLLTPSTFPGTDALVNGQTVGDTELKNSTHDVASAALTLSNRVELRFGFKLDDPALYTYQITIKGQAYTYTAEDLTYDEAKDRYYLYFTNCFASELDEPVTVVVLRDGVQVSRSLTYTANTYIKSNADAGDALADVLKALYNYGESARIYAASLQG